MLSLVLPIERLPFITVPKSTDFTILDTPKHLDTVPV